MCLLKKRAHSFLFNTREKMLIARTRNDEYQYEGIKIVDLADWLLEA